MTPSTVLQTRGLRCGYRDGSPVLDGVTLAVAEGRTVALVGPSGCGKTTLLKTLLGLVPTLGGTATILGTTLGATGRPRPGSVGYVPQRLGLVEQASVLHNVTAGMLPQTGGLRSLLGTFAAHHLERAHLALERLGLHDKHAQAPRQLSGGERRRVVIARALAQRPALLLGDELLSELDEGTAAVVLAALRELQDETGMGLLMVEHDLERSCAHADVVCCLGGGRLQATLTPSTDRLHQARQLLAAHGHA